VRFGLNAQNFGIYGDPRLLAELARDAEACDIIRARPRGRV